MLANRKLMGLKGTRLLKKLLFFNVQLIPLISYTNPFKSTNTLK